jgi:hypothetical protein
MSIPKTAEAPCFGINGKLHRAVKGEAKAYGRIPIM